MAPTTSRQPSAPTVADPLTDMPVDAQTARWPRRLQLASVATLVIGYAALSHYSTESPHAKALGATLSIAPVLLIGMILLWRWTVPLIAAAVSLTTCALLYCYWPFIERNYAWADLVQQCGVYGLVALSFARSLFAGRVPLCTLLAEKMHGELTAAEIAYTRRATQAWLVFYVLIASVIFVLFLTVSLNAWSLFVNFVIFGLMLAMGLADHVIRRRVLPRHPPAGIMTIIRRALIG